MNESKPKRKYTRRYKRGKFADDKEASLQPTGRSDHDYCKNAYIKRRKAAGLPTRDSEWKKTAAGWKRSGPEPEMLPEHQITRYFKLTKTLEEIQESDLPKVQDQKERSELRVPTLERSETITL